MACLPRLREVIGSSEPESETDALGWRGARIISPSSLELRGMLDEWSWICRSLKRCGCVCDGGRTSSSPFRSSLHWFEHISVCHFTAWNPSAFVTSLPETHQRLPLHCLRHHNPCHCQLSMLHSYAIFAKLIVVDTHLCERLLSLLVIVIHGRFVCSKHQDFHTSHNTPHFPHASVSLRLQDGTHEAHCNSNLDNLDRPQERTFHRREYHE